MSQTIACSCLDNLNLVSAGISDLMVHALMVFNHIMNRCLRRCLVHRYTYLNGYIACFKYVQKVLEHGYHTVLKGASKISLKMFLVHRPEQLRVSAEVLVQIGCPMDKKTC